MSGTQNYRISPHFHIQRTAQKAHGQGYQHVQSKIPEEKAMKMDTFPLRDGGLFHESSRTYDTGLKIAVGLLGVVLFTRLYG